MSTVECWDPVVGRWQSTEPMTTLRSRVGVAVLKGKRVLSYTGNLAKLLYLEKPCNVVKKQINLMNLYNKKEPFLLLLMFYPLRAASPPYKESNALYLHQNERQDCRGVELKQKIFKYLMLLNIIKIKKC